MLYSFMVRICFVCLGNICRSPTAEGVMRHLLLDAGLESHILLDSAGTSAYHEGEPPDARSHSAAKRRGIVLEGRSRQFQHLDFSRFEYVIAMDTRNRDDLLALAENEEERAKVSLLRDFDSQSPADSSVPDPYYGGPGGFDEVLDICTAGCQGLLQTLRDAHGF